jgi:hypothetical protein
MMNLLRFGAHIPNVSWQSTPLFTQEHGQPRWWQYEAVEPRQRLGGIGTPASEVLAYVPVFSYGLPSVWISQWPINYYTGIAVDTHGNPIGERFASNAFKGVAIDPANI